MYNNANKNKGKFIKRFLDIPPLRDKLITISQTKTHIEVASYAILLGKHILELSKIEPCDNMLACFDIMQKWIDGKAKFQEARQIAFSLHRQARDEINPLKIKVLRTLGQLCATPHVKRHALVASDYAVKVVNLLYPNDLDSVKRERELQIELMTKV